MRVLVTGVTGQVGCRLARQLLAANHEVRGTVWPGDPKTTGLERIAGLDIEVMSGDLTDPNFTKEAIRGVHGVIHTANLVGPHFYNNVHVTMEVARACGAEADTLERVVYVSSSGVFPNDGEEIACAYHPVDELHPKRPKGEYPMSKLAGEMIIQATARSTGLRYSIVRPTHVVSGDLLFRQFSASTVIKLLRRGQRNPNGELHMKDGTELWQQVESMVQDPEQPCSVCDYEGRPWYYQPNDARDVAHMLVCALTRPEAIGEDFNCGGPEIFTFPEAARKIAAITDREVLELRLPVRYRYDHAIGKAKSWIGFNPQGTLEAMMESARAFAYEGVPDYSW